MESDVIAAAEGLSAEPGGMFSVILRFDLVGVVSQLGETIEGIRIEMEVASNERILTRRTMVLGRRMDFLRQSTNFTGLIPCISPVFLSWC